MFYQLINEEFQTIGLFDDLELAKQICTDLYNQNKGCFFQINQINLNVLSSGDMDGIWDIGEIHF